MTEDSSFRGYHQYLRGTCYAIFREVQEEEAARTGRMAGVANQWK